MVTSEGCCIGALPPVREDAHPALDRNADGRREAQDVDDYRQIRLRHLCAHGTPVESHGMAVLTEYCLPIGRVHATLRGVIEAICSPARSSARSSS